MRENMVRFSRTALFWFSLIFLGKSRNACAQQSSRSRSGVDENNGNFEFNLLELQEIFMVAYPESVKFFRPRNSSRASINERPIPPSINGGSCLQSTVFPANQLPRMIKDMIAVPKASFYTGENHNGTQEDINFASVSPHKGCVELHRVNSEVKSIQTYGKCVRVFSHFNCKGSENDYAGLKETLEGIESVGPCLPDEFGSSFFKGYSSQAIAKNTSDIRSRIPDLVEFFSATKLNSDNSASAMDDSVQYVLGSQNRIEFIVIEDANPQILYLFQSRPNMEESGFYKSLEKQAGDILCYALPLSFGGPANETYNIFACSISCEKDWTDVISKISSVYLDEPLTIALNFVYDTKRKSRPTEFYYWIGYTYANGYVSYGRIQN